MAGLLALSRKGKAKCSGCFMTLMEMLYRVWKDEGEAAGRMAYEQCLSLPMNWIHETPELLERAAGATKAGFRLSLADAWIAACAELSSAILVHKDPELGALPVKQERLPYKS